MSWKISVDLLLVQVNKVILHLDPIRIYLLVFGLRILKR